MAPSSPGSSPTPTSIASPSTRRPASSFFDLVTVQETGFFRHPDHFVVLADHVLPTIDGPVRIWSAACSNGQEPYSLAMVLAERRVDGRVLATDMSTSALRRTREARYLPASSAGSATSARPLHGRVAGGRWAVADEVRQRVDVEPLQPARSAALPPRRLPGRVLPQRPHLLHR